MPCSCKGKTLLSAQQSKVWQSWKFVSSADFRNKFLNMLNSAGLGDVEQGEALD